MGHLVMALVQGMNSQAETLKEARGRLEARGSQHRNTQFTGRPTRTLEKPYN